MSAAAEQNAREHLKRLQSELLNDVSYFASVAQGMATTNNEFRKKLIEQDIHVHRFYHHLRLLQDIMQDETLGTFEAAVRDRVEQFKVMLRPQSLSASPEEAERAERDIRAVFVELQDYLVRRQGDLVENAVANPSTQSAEGGWFTNIWYKIFKYSGGHK